ncbi:proline-rich protein 14 isoform X2 [Engystomops pustulosus]
METYSPRSLTRALNMASPLERERRRVLSVQLRDIAHQAGPLRAGLLQAETPPCERTSGADDLLKRNQVGVTGFCKNLEMSQSPPYIPMYTEEPSHASPAVVPPSVPSAREEPSHASPSCLPAVVPPYVSCAREEPSHASPSCLPAVVPPYVSCAREEPSHASPSCLHAVVPPYISCAREEPSHASPYCLPAVVPPSVPAVREEPGWGLLPLFHSVRSKLESFAEIFLTPVKSQRASWSSSANGKPSWQESFVSGELSGATVQPVPPSPEPCGDFSTLLPGEGTAEDGPSPSSPQRTSPSLSSSVLCRPPLQRYLSCPLLPVTQHNRRHSLDTVGHSTEPCTCRKRRHSLGTVEECRNLPMVPLSLSCLRKENHPSVLRQSPYQLGDVHPSPNGSDHNVGSPESLCMDKYRGRGLRAAGDQVTKESPPDSHIKSLENLSKGNKVSNIQIRKRVLRQEGNLTPLGLPKRVRLQKDDFSLEEIYTNKNYHTPTEKRKFETIFEEPVLKGGALVLTSQRPLRRIMIFKDGSSTSRKRKKKGKAAGRTRRCTGAAGPQANIDYESLLQHKLNQLEAALQGVVSDP